MNKKIESLLGQLKTAEKEVENLKKEIFNEEVSDTREQITVFFDKIITGDTNSLMESLRDVKEHIINRLDAIKGISPVFKLDNLNYCQQTTKSVMDSWTNYLYDHDVEKIQKVLKNILTTYDDCINSYKLEMLSRDIEDIENNSNSGNCCGNCCGKAAW